MYLSNHLTRCICYSFTQNMKNCISSFYFRYLQLLTLLGYICEQYPFLAWLTILCRKDCFIGDFPLDVCGHNVYILRGTVLVFLPFVIVPQKLPAEKSIVHASIINNEIHVFINLFRSFRFLMLNYWSKFLIKQ